MRLTAFDARVAEAHGYRIVILPDGATASVPASLAAAAESGTYVPTSGVIPAEPAEGDMSTSDYGAADGDCGMSWVSLEARGGSKATLLTGMALRPDAGDPWDVHWNVNISDPGGSSTQSYSEGQGTSGLLTWTAYARILGLTKGYAFATVVWYSSYTVTDNGWVCWSAGPTTSEKIT
ncbi:hypothetical protein [Actinoplanes sp. NBRC 101535]|uniref:hypothetical protein n=1 Tax=Actinoplanes sp. NBRC 101535 TaxID=3032196 RepID=UPI00255579EB|nr:hypothetical protein [Actinoplanes sp. NBRC 101535]